MRELVWQAFSLVCGQNPEHTWTFGQAPLPFCQRCTGLYAGACLCLGLHWILRPRYGGRFIAWHCLFLLLAAPFGFHLIQDGPLLRALTGVLCGFGIGTFLWFVPATTWGGVDVPTRARAGSWYALGLCAALLLVPLGASLGGVLIGCVIQGLAAAGVFSLGGLVAANVAFGLLGFLRIAGVLLTSRFKRP